MLRPKLLLFAASLLAAAAASHADPPAPEVILELDVVYTTAGGETLKLDIARPGKIVSPRPAVVCFHGGGYTIGNKSSYRGFIDRLAREGFVAASVGYRFAPKYKLPAQIEDAKCAVRFLRENAEHYGIDPERIGALGDSAGGGLAVKLGVTAPEDGFEGQCESAGSSRVQAVVNYYSTSDLTRWKISESARAEVQRAYGKSSEEVREGMFGTSDLNSPIMKRLSALPYVSKDDPPVLTFHGTADPIVPLEQAHFLHDALTAAGVENRLEIIEGGGHGWTGEARERTNRMSIEFLKQKLRP